jgi:hypothetical protein
MKVLFLIVLACVGCSTIQPYAKGAYGIEFTPEREEIGARIDSMIRIAEDDVKQIREIVKRLNEREENLGTGALIGAILPRIAFRLVTEGSLKTQSVNVQNTGTTQ